MLNEGSWIISQWLDVCKTFRDCKPRDTEIFPLTESALLLTHYASRVSVYRKLECSAIWSILTLWSIMEPKWWVVCSFMFKHFQYHVCLTVLDCYWDESYALSLYMQVDNIFYIYQEYVHPGSLSKCMNEHYGAITESIVRNFTRQIVSGLAYMHSKHIAHRYSLMYNLSIKFS